MTPIAMVDGDDVVIHINSTKRFDGIRIVYRVNVIDQLWCFCFSVASNARIGRRSICSRKSEMYSMDPFWNRTSFEIRMNERLLHSDTTHHRRDN